MSETCQTCADATKTRRYCAPARCYCGHDTCPAFATWSDPWTQPFNDAPSKRDTKSRDSWANRQGGTWIDQL